MKKIVICGGTGTVGSALAEKLADKGYEVVILSRGQPNLTSDGRIKFVHWDAKTVESWSQELEKAQGVINLSGENIGAGLWTKSKKERILSSRLDAGNVLVEAIRICREKPEQFIQASAIGIYGISETEVFEEDSEIGNDYLAKIGIKWEESTAAVEEMGIKRAVIRTGVVLDLKEGAFPKVLLPFKIFIGGRLGTGRQWFSWIHLQDEVDAIIYIVENQLDGIFNLVAPNPMRNFQVAKTIAEVFQRPNWFPIPGFGLRLLLGDMSTLVLDGQNVLPKRLLIAGYNFKFAELKMALISLKNKK